ncbi:MAG: PAS domain S-box protein [Deltaproteobacteria bacterium]|nr:PAS domain S-box protein [Deltaproteobacteria bacterium]
MGNDRKERKALGRNLSQVIFYSPLHIMLITAVSVFFAEALVMVVFYFILPLEIRERELLIILLDPVLLMIFLVPSLYFFLFRPVLNTVRMRREAEQELKRERDNFHKYLDIAGVMVMVLDESGKIKLMNKRGCDILGYSERELAGRDWFHFVPERMRGEVRAVYAGLVSGEAEAEGYFENPVVTRTGEERTILWHNIILREDERITGTLSSGEDITERKRTERALKESERRYRQIHNTAFDGLIVSDAEDRIIDCNPSAETIFGYKRAELIGMELIRLMPEQYRQRHKEGVKWFLETGISTIQGKVVELEGLRKNGEIFPIELVVNSFTIGGQVNFTGTIRDITERKRAEKEKELLQTQINQAQKMEAIGRFAGGIAHDFNNVLTAIRGNAELALEDLDKSDPLYQRIDGIILSVMLASKLTKQLMLFSRGHPFELVPLNVNKVIEDLLIMISRLIGEEVSISTELEPGVWNVNADEGNLEQVIMNLAVNARDAMPGGGTLFIKTENVVVSADESRLMPGSKPGEAVRITVRDTGTGMEKEVAARIFEPFFTTKEPGKGTGFGLAVVYGIVRQHGGWISVDSAPGKGTTFLVYMPAVIEKRRPERAHAPGELNGSGERVLLVEDDLKVRDFTKTALQEHGYSVAEAARVKDAIDIFDKEGGAFDIVLSDISLSDRTGFDLADYIAARNSKAAVVLMSGFLDMKTQWPTMVEKGFRFLQKPYSLGSLLRTVKTALGERRMGR